MKKKRKRKGEPNEISHVHAPGDPPLRLAHALQHHGLPAVVPVRALRRTHTHSSGINRDNSWWNGGGGGREQIRTTPTLTLSGEGSARNASVTPRMGSLAAGSTWPLPPPSPAAPRESPRQRRRLVTSPCARDRRREGEGEVWGGGDLDSGGETKPTAACVHRSVHFLWSTCCGRGGSAGESLTCHCMWGPGGVWAFGSLELGTLEKPRLSALVIPFLFRLFCFRDLGCLTV